MIKLTDKIDALQSASAELLKIRLTFNAYSDIALFWQQNTSGCVISMLGSDMVIYAPDDTDFEELSCFLKVISPKSIFTSRYAAEKLGLTGTELAAVMVKTAEGGEKGESDELSSKELYEILISGGFKLPEYPDFAVDICHRINHGQARLIAKKEKYTAVCFNADEYCLINGIVSFQKGMGSRALSHISAEFEGKTVIACCKPSLCGFYTKNGFDYLYDAVYWEAN